MGESAVLLYFILKGMEEHKNYLNMVNYLLYLTFIIKMPHIFRLKFDPMHLHLTGQPAGGVGSVLGGSVPATGGTGATGTGVGTGG